jgi:hypothetical protein
MAELSKGAGIAIGLGITAAIGIGIYAIVKSKPKQQTIQLPSNYQQLPQYQSLKQQNPSLNEASLAKLLSSILKKSGGGGSGISTGGGSIGGGSGTSSGKRIDYGYKQYNPYPGYNDYPEGYYLGADYRGDGDYYGGGYGGGYYGGGYYAGGGYDYNFGQGYYVGGGGYSGGYGGGGYSYYA